MIDGGKHHRNTLQRAFGLPPEASSILMGKKIPQIAQRMSIAPVSIQIWVFQVPQKFLPASSAAEAN